MRLVLAACLVLTGCGGKAGNPKVRISNSGTGLQMWCLPVSLAQTLGYYKDEGLDVALENVPTAVRSRQALIGGSVDVAADTYDGNITLAAEGRRMKSFFVLTRRDGKVLIVAPGAGEKIKRVEDLKGKLIGVSTLGSMTNRWFAYYLARKGLESSQYSAVGIGYGASAIAAIENGRVDAAGLTGGDHFHLLRRHPGLRVLADVSTPEGMRETYGDAFAGGALIATGEWLDRNREAARRLTRAMRRTLDWIASHSDAEVRERMPEGFRSQDAEVDLEIIHWGRQSYTADGAMPKGAPQAVRRYLDATNEKVRGAKIDLAATWTDEYLQGAK